MTFANSERWAVRLVCGIVLCASLVVNTTPAAAENFKPFKLKTLEGTQTSLTDVLGKATFVVFFFPTCGFCNAALPHIQKLHDTYKDDGLSVVWINVIPREEKLIARWREKHGYTVPILLGTGSVPRDYRVTMTPTHYLIDAKGQVIAAHSGYKPGDENAIERQIQTALGLTR